MAVRNGGGGVTDPHPIAGVKPEPAPDMKRKRGAKDAPNEPVRRGGRETVLFVKPLPPDSPVQPLGFNGLRFHFLDSTGQHVETGTKCDKGDLVALFGADIGFLDEHYTAFKQDGSPNGFNQSLVQRAMLIACKGKGFFNPEGRIHGRGAHRGSDGELVLHCGDETWVANAPGIEAGSRRPPYAAKPGRIGKLLFPLKEAISPPALPGQAATRAEMWTLLVEVFGSWNYKDPDWLTFEDDGERVAMPAYMAFAWTLMATLCGAVDKRAPMWVTGPSGAGKSELQKAILAVIGEDWAIFAKNMTEAYVTQTLQQDRLPVLFDEAEQSEQNENYIANMLTLAKLAFDGSKKGRGSADGKAITTQIFAAMQFGSVLTPEFKPEERNRMVIVELQHFPPGAPPYQPHAILKDIAPRLRRRMLEQWQRYEWTVQPYAAEMARRGWSGREQAAYGPVLAAADLALWDGVPLASAPRVGQLVQALEPMLQRSRSDVEDHPDQCIDHLASSRLPSQGGRAEETVSQWIIKGVVESMLSGPHTPNQVDRILQANGMRLCNLREDHGGDDGTGQGGMVPLKTLVDENGHGVGFLMIAGKTHEGMKQIFKSSKSFSGGKWVQALRRFKMKITNSDGEVVAMRNAITNKRDRFGGGKPMNAVLIPLEAVVGMAEMNAAIEDERLARAHSGG